MSTGIECLSKKVLEKVNGRSHFEEQTWNKKKSMADDNNRKLITKKSQRQYKHSNIKMKSEKSQGHHKF